MGSFIVILKVSRFLPDQSRFSLVGPIRHWHFNRDPVGKVVKCVFGDSVDSLESGSSGGLFPPHTYHPDTFSTSFTMLYPWNFDRNPACNICQKCMDSNECLIRELFRV